MEQTQKQGVYAMKKTIKKAIAILFALFVLASCLPLSVLAVDPVSASVMANAFAQAVAAYGASNGVAMTFDVANTNGIGEGVHELWSRFRAGQQTTDDFETIAAAVWPDLYQKVLVGESAVLGLSVAAEYVQEMDDFWNWVLSGPAEMTRVDNEYYQFSQAQIGSGAVPISVWVGADPVYNTPQITTLNNYNIMTYGLYVGVGRYNTLHNIAGTSQTFSFFTPSTGSGVHIVMCSINSDARYGYAYQPYDYTNTQSYNYNYTSYDPVIYCQDFQMNSYFEPNQSLPTYNTRDAGIAAFADLIAAGPVSDTIGIKSYGLDGVVDIPDNTDVNYQPLPYVGGLDIPWDDTLFGDGTGTLTDAQSEAAADAVGGVIVSDGELTLAGDTTADVPGDETDDPPSTDPDDYQLPGLADVFPFCIPFDVYHFLQALAATPVAPSFTCTLQLPSAIGGARTIELDFDTPTFNQLAQLLRLMELFAFIVGLALLTRSMFIRG